MGWQQDFAKIAAHAASEAVNRGNAMPVRPVISVRASRVAAVVLAAGICVSAAGTALADNAMVMAMAGKMREQGMAQWRNGDFLSAYGNCFGSRQMLLRLKGVPKEAVARGAGYAELCMSLALHQMNIRSKNHSPCKLLLDAQKNFKLVDETRKAQGMLADDNGYLAELLKDRGCRSQATSQ